MKICPNCGHRNWEPGEKCEACGKKLLDSRRGANKPDGPTGVPPSSDELTDGKVRGPTK